MVAHQGPRPLDTLMQEKLVWGLSCALAEAANEVGCTYARFMRQITQAKIPFQVGLDELNASTQGGGGHTACGVMLHRKGCGVVTQEIAGQRGGYAIEEKQSALEASA